MDISTFGIQEHKAMILIVLLICLIAIGFKIKSLFSETDNEKKSNLPQTKEDEEEDEVEINRDEIHLKSGKVITVEYEEDNLSDEDRILYYYDEDENCVLNVAVDAIEYVLTEHSKKCVKVEG